MRNFIVFGMILMVSLNFISCKSTSTMRYLQDIDNGVQPGISAQTPDYLIKANDNLYVNIQSINMEVNQIFSPSKSTGYSGGTQADFGIISSQYLNGYLVNHFGMIILPVIGEVRVAGMTEDAAKDSIQMKVNEFFKDATVKVKILTYMVTILGEVRNPGVYYNYNKSVTILELLGMANGTTDNASIRKVLVLRTTENGRKSYRLDLTGKKMMTSEAFYLLPNDVVYIEPDKFKNFAVNTTAFSLTLSALSTTILILSYLNK